jgi:hypothetical protein
MYKIEKRDGRRGYSSEFKGYFITKWNPDSRGC